MTANIRQEAVERARPVAWRVATGDVEAIIDASGLIDQLTQATEDIRGLSALLWEAATERNKAREQLAAERALLDELRAEAGWFGERGLRRSLLNRIDTHRAAEHSDG